LASATAEHPIYFPNPGWSEQEPHDWWDSTRRAVKTALAKAKLRAADVAGIGSSGQMHGSVFLDKRGEPLCRALLWNDQRTVAECAEIEKRAGGRAALIKLVQNVALTGYTAPKILWLRNHQPAVFAKVRTVVLPKDFINYRLTGELCCEASDASGTLLLDVPRRQWSLKLMEKLKLDPELFPAVVESPDVVGTLTPAAAKALGLTPGIPVAAGAGDQAAAAVGTGVVRRGVVSATIGTSGVVFAFSERPVPNDEGLLQSFCHAVPSAWGVFGCMLSAGGSLQWAREVLYADRLAGAKNAAARDELYTEMIDEAAAAPEADELLFHPYLTGERCPYPHPHARGAFVGLTRRHARGHLVRAVLEGITLGMGRQVEIMRRLGVKVSEVRLAGGGARNAWWRQLQADVYGARCVVLRSEEGSALGAAILGAVGAGHFASVPAACAKLARVQSEYTPDTGRTRQFARRMKAAARTYETLEPIYRRV
jgi:xylulokinase